MITILIAIAKAFCFFENPATLSRNHARRFGQEETSLGHTLLKTMPSVGDAH